MKKFIGLVDSNAQANAYRSALGLHIDEVREHMKHVTFYRQITKRVDEIKTLLKNKNDNKEKIKELRDRLKFDMESWKNE